MLLSVLFFLLSIIPSALIIVWLMNRKKEDLQYKKAVSRRLSGAQQPYCRFLQFPVY